MNRVTIMLDDDTNKKVRAYQIKKIKETENTYSFSRSINDLLRGQK